MVVCGQLAFFQGMTQILKFPMYPSISDSCTRKADEEREKNKNKEEHGRIFGPEMTPIISIYMLYPCLFLMLAEVPLGKLFDFLKRNYTVLCLFQRC